LHEALRQVLGDHVAQKGSLVAPDRLRFDFSHPKPMSAAELERVEDIANDIVLQNSPVTTRLMAQDDAITSGARALFGEKYGDEVRVVAMGESSNTSGSFRWSARRASRLAYVALRRLPAPLRARRRITSASSPRRRLRSLKYQLRICRAASLKWSMNGASLSASSPRPRRSSPWVAVPGARAPTACEWSATSS
jgi:hypothetical protein